jgi:transcriptional regulator with XRE-family HTH domain
MTRWEIVQWRINKIFSERSKYSFPALLEMLRRVQGLSRKQVEIELGFDEARLFYLEKGDYNREISVGEIRLIADYYGLDAQELYEMSQEYHRDYNRVMKPNAKYFKLRIHKNRPKVLV